MRNNSIELPLFFIFLCVPFFRFSEGIWDGAIISYAVRIGDLSSLHSWFYASGWELQYHAIETLHIASKFIQIKFEYFVSAVTLFAVYLTSHESRKLSERTFKLSPTGSRTVGIIILVFPAWNVLVSSVLNFHIVCFALGIFSVNHYWSGYRFHKIISLSMVLISFQLNSMLVFIPVLFLVTISARKRISLFGALKNRETIFCFSIAAIFFVTKKWFNPSYGLYEGYNELLPWDQLNSLKAILYGLIDYSTFLVIPAICLIPLLLRILSQTSSPIPSGRMDLCLVMNSIVLFFAGALPYLVVGKSTSLFEIHDWTQRQAILISLPVSLLAGIFIEQSMKMREGRIGRNFYLPVLYFVSLTLPIYFLSSGVSEKLNRLSFDQDLVDYLRENIQPLPAGIVKIEFEKLPTPNPRVYESNYLFYRAYEESKWWTSVRLPSDDYPEIPSVVNRQNSDEFVYEWTRKKCKSTLSFGSEVYEAKPFTGIFGQHAMRTRLNLIKQSSNCEMPPN